MQGDPTLTIYGEYTARVDTLRFNCNVRAVLTDAMREMGLRTGAQYVYHGLPGWVISPTGKLCAVGDSPTTTVVGNVMQGKGGAAVEFGAEVLRADDGRLLDYRSTSAHFVGAMQCLVLALQHRYPDAVSVPRVDWASQVFADTPQEKDRVRAAYAARAIRAGFTLVRTILSYGVTGGKTDYYELKKSVRRKWADGSSSCAVDRYLLRIYDAHSPERGQQPSRGYIRVEVEEHVSSRRAAQHVAMCEPTATVLGLPCGVIPERLPRKDSGHKLKAALSLLAGAVPDEHVAAVRTLLAGLDEAVGVNALAKLLERGLLTETTMGKSKELAVKFPGTAGPRSLVRLASQAPSYKGDVDE